jgi:hypothetical protein
MKMKVADLVPREDFTMHSELAADEIRERIASSINPNKPLGARLFQIRPQKRPFEGVQAGDSFNLHSFLGRNSFFSPVTKVNVIGAPSGSEVHIRMRLSRWVAVMMGLWLGFSGLATLINLVNALISEGTMYSRIIGISFPAILFLWGYLVCIVGFKLDSRRIKGFFECLLRK